MNNGVPSDSVEGLVPAKLGDVADIVMGQSPDSETVHEDESGLPFLQGCAEFGSREPTPELYCSSPLRVAPADSLLISVRAPVGTMNWADQRYCIGRGLGSVKGRDGVSDTKFLGYALTDGVDYLHRRSQGSTFLAIGSEDLRSFPVPAFSFDDQRDISKVLGTADAAIEETEALIKKYQQIKAGLMHDLFTRGIGVDGKLRPPREQAPELYQETPIGWIPRDWGLEPCAELCSRICVGIVIQPAKYYVPGGVPALRSANVREFGVDPSNMVYISEASNQLLSKSQLRVGDIVSVRTGYPGTSAVVPEEFDGANCVDILISSPLQAIESTYLCAWINSDFGKGQILRQQGGIAQQHFNVGEMRQLLVGLPSIKEQRQIMGILQECEKKLALEKQTRSKLQKQKSGLMADLLSGRVEVSNV